VTAINLVRLFTDLTRRPLAAAFANWRRCVAVAEVGSANSEGSASSWEQCIALGSPTIALVPEDHTVIECTGAVEWIGCFVQPTGCSLDLNSIGVKHCNFVR